MGTGLHLIGKHKGERLEYTVGYAADVGDRAKVPAYS